jgi:dihydropyrimidinase
MVGWDEKKAFPPDGRVNEAGRMSKRTDFVIRGGTVVTPAGAAPADVLVRGERIEAVGRIPDDSALPVVDAAGLLVLPGAIDPHVHFNDAFMGTVSVHDYETGTRAAAFGGVTTIIDFSNQAIGRSLGETLEAKFHEAEGRAYVDWGVHPVITDPRPEVLAEIPGLVNRGAPTFKCYMTYREEGLMVEDDDIRRILARTEEAGATLLVHAEDNDLVEDGITALVQAGMTAPADHARSRPPEAETRAIHRLIKAARATRGRVLVVHLASAEGLASIAAARTEGVPIKAETCTHYLVFTEAELGRPDGIKWICSPPLRPASTQAELWRGIADGRIALVSSDDAAYSWQAKLMGETRFDKCPNGIPGIEVRLPLLFSEGVAKGRITLERLVEILSAAPARIFGLAPRKGSLAPGADADIVLFDPRARWKMGLATLHMAADWSAYEGVEVLGRVVKVFSRGELIVDGERFLAGQGRGVFLKRSPAERRSS